MRSLLSMMGQNTKRITPESVALGKKLFTRLVDASADIHKINTVELTIFDSLSEENAIQIEAGNVGINFLAVPVIFYYAYTEFNNNATNELIDDITKCLVLCCPDYTTAWNRRKSLLQQNFAEKNLKNELILTKFALKLHPKSSETYAHRKWIFSKIIQNFFAEKQDYATPKESRVKNCDLTQNVDNLDTNIEFQNFKPSVGAIELLLSMAHVEFEVCHKTALLHPSNYNGWAHKCWIINYIKNYVIKSLHIHANRAVKLDSVTSICDIFCRFMRADISEMMTSLEKQISDVSISASLLFSLSTWTELALLRNNGQFLSSFSSNVIMTWIELLHHNSKLLHLFDVHETLWRHRTNLFLCFNAVIRRNVKIFENSKIEAFSLENETEFCQRFIGKIASFHGNNPFVKNHIRCLNEFYK